MRLNIKRGGFNYPLRQVRPGSESSQTLIVGDGLTANAIVQRDAASPRPEIRFWQRLKEFFSGDSDEDGLPFKSTNNPPFHVFLLHLVPLSAALVIVALNLHGYWIGKELSGVSHNDAPKSLALQLTAKTHELLMLASLSEALLTYLLRVLALGEGLPFGSLASATKFKDLSYLWSQDFRATCKTKYANRSSFTALVIVCMILSLTIGPSSATALIPRLDIWHAGQAEMIVETSADHLWPASIGGDDFNTSTCSSSTFGCFNPMAWDSAAANFMSYWGHSTIGDSDALPQRIHIPGISSLRSMDVRQSGPGHLSTTATTQHAVVADMVNTFRFLTFPSRSNKCRTTWSTAMCSYRDVSWYLDAFQPFVFTSCSESSFDSSEVKYPAVNRISNDLETISMPMNIEFTNSTSPQFRWTTTSESRSLNASIGVAMRLYNGASANDYTCTIETFWARSRTSTNFTTMNNIIGSVLLEGTSHLLDDGRHSNRRIEIDGSWAQQVVESALPSAANTTAFSKLLNVNGDNSNINGKLEAVVALLFAENMAHLGYGATPLSISSTNLYLKIRGDLTHLNSTSSQAEPPRSSTLAFPLKTSMTGYGYGMYTLTGFSYSALIAVIILTAYSILALTHVVSLYLSKNVYVVSWREERDMLIMCLQSKFWSADRHHFPMEHGGGVVIPISGPHSNILQDVVIVTTRRGKAEISRRYPVKDPDGD